MFEAIKRGWVKANDWQKENIGAKIALLRADPLYRAAELMVMAVKICDELVFKPLEELRPELSTWDGFKIQSWKTWGRIKDGGKKVWTATGDCSALFVERLSVWFDDFNDRMMVGGEKAAFLSTPWVKHRLLSDFHKFGRQAAYTSGYIFGYVCEQVASGALTGGTYLVAKVAVFGGIRLGGGLAARTLFAVGTRLHLLKQT